MIAEGLAIAVLVMTGIPIAKALDPASSASRVVGEGFLFGSGVAALVLLVESHVGLAWSAPALFVPLGATALVAGSVVFRRLRAHDDRDAIAGPTLASIVIDAVTASTVVLYAIFATLARPWDWDFWAIWGLKGRIFFEARAIDWSFLENRWNAFAHGEYPPLLPLVLDVPAFARGAWSDRWLALIGVAFAVAALLVLRGHVLEEARDRRVAALATLAATGPALASWVGLADVPLLAFATAGALSLRRASRMNASTLPGALLIGFAALTKNEGVALLGAVAIASLVAGGERRIRRTVSLWPAFALAALWQIPRLARGLQSDLFLGSVAERLSAERLLETARLLATAPPHHPLFWIAIALALVVGARSLRAESFLVTLLVVQLGALLLTYSLTANDIAWQITTSWMRVSDQLALIALFLAVAVLVSWASRDDAESAPTVAQDDRP